MLSLAVCNKEKKPRFFNVDTGRLQPLAALAAEPAFGISSQWLELDSLFLTIIPNCCPEHAAIPVQASLAKCPELYSYFVLYYAFPIS